MEKARIFISYKRKNKDKVFSIVKKIETQLGVKCWIDLDGIESNEQFRNKICNAIDNSEVVLFMHSSVHLSINFQKDYTIKELNYAEAKDKRVILIKLDDAPLDKDFLMEYGTKNNIDSRDETQFQKLLKDLKVWLDLPQQAQDDIKYKEKTNTSLFTRLVNKIMGKTKKASAFEGNVSSSSNTKEETSKDSSSKVQKIYDEDGNIKYEGEVRNGLYHGQGTLYFDGKIVYEGQFVDGNFHGVGTLYLTDGTKYVGEFKDDKIHGWATGYFVNGNKYEGQFVDGNFHGQGTYYFANGEKYVGQWENNEYNGQGTLHTEDGNKYVGEFKDGVEDGEGTLYYADGDKYVGEFKDGVQNGQGTLYFADGGKYEGEFKDGVQHGIGTYDTGDGVIYEGKFENGKMHGKGIIYYSDGNSEEVTCRMGEIL